jgi:hypothetical protein
MTYGVLSMVDDHAEIVPAVVRCLIRRTYFVIQT